MITTWNKNIKPEQKTDIEKYLNPYLWLLPNWVQNIHINLWDADDGGADISIKVNYNYRNICLDFYSCYFVRDESDKQMEMIHELCHTFFGIVADYAKGSFNNLVPKNEAEKFNEHLQQELAARHEAATQDLAFVIYNKFSEINKNV